MTNIVNILEKNTEWTSVHLTELEKNLLREHTYNPAIWIDQVNQQILTDIFKRIPTIEHDIILYSGAETSLKNYKFNEHGLPLKYFTSSYNIQVAQKYTKMQDSKDACLFILHVTQGSKIICLDQISVHGKAEHEVLLNSNAMLCVTKIENQIEENGYIVVHVTYNDSEI